MSRTKVLRAVFGAALLGVFMLALLPVAPVVHVFSWQDKLEHAMAFAALMLLGGVAWSVARRRVAAGLLVYGAAIEAAQGLTTWRVADPRDWLADALGVALGALLIGALARRTQVGAGGQRLSRGDCAA